MDFSVTLNHPYFYFIPGNNSQRQLLKIHHFLHLHFYFRSMMTTSSGILAVILIYYQKITCKSIILRYIFNPRTSLGKKCDSSGTKVVNNNVGNQAKES